jgi:hypothetical protein
MFKRSYPVLGQSGAEEMCNLYLMYYTLSDRDDFKICFDEEDRALSWKLPEGKCSRVGKPVNFTVSIISTLLKIYWKQNRGIFKTAKNFGKNHAFLHSKLFNWEKLMSFIKIILKCEKTVK